MANKEIKWNIELDNLDIMLNLNISSRLDNVSMVRDIDIYKERSDELKLTYLLYKLDTLKGLLKDENV